MFHNFEGKIFNIFVCTFTYPRFLLLKSISCTNTCIVVSIKSACDFFFFLIIRNYLIDDLYLVVVSAKFYDFVIISISGQYHISVNVPYKMLKKLSKTTILSSQKLC